LWLDFAALFNIFAALPTVRRTLYTAHEEAMVEMIAAGIAFDDDMIAGLNRVLCDTALLEAADGSPLYFPFDELARLRVFGLQLHERVGTAVGELQYLALEMDALVHEIVRRNRMVRQKRTRGSAG